MVLAHKQIDRIKSILLLMEYDVLTDAQHTLVVGYESQFERNGFLSERQIEVLEDIFQKAAEKA